MAGQVSLCPTANTNSYNQGAPYPCLSILLLPTQPKKSSRSLMWHTFWLCLIHLPFLRTLSFI